MKPKKKLLLDEVNKVSNSGVGDEEDDDDDIDNGTSKSGMGVCAGVNTLNSVVGKEPTTNEDADKNKVEVPRGLDSDYFGDAPYWSNGTIATDV